MTSSEHKKRKSNRRRAKQKNGGSGFLKYFRWAVILGLLLGAVGVATIAAMFWKYGSDPNLPDIETISDYRPMQVSRVMAADGSVIGEIYADEGRRTVITYDEIPKVVINAFVAAEDDAFLKHNGIDYVGLMRAALVNLRERQKSQGASTITQQVVRNLLLTRTKSFRRKFQEIILARRLEKSLSKEDILTLYANEIYLGHRRYGVVEAAQFYFGKKVGELDAGEAAVLAALPKAPNRLSPKIAANHERIKDRQTYVLKQMLKQGYITKEEADRFIEAPIEIASQPYPSMGLGPEWIDVAKTNLEEHFGKDEMYLAGGDVVTTVSIKAQEIARKALRQGLREYDVRKGYSYPVRSVTPDKIKLEAARLAKRLPKDGIKNDEDYLAVILKIKDEPGEILVDLGGIRASILISDKDMRTNPEGKLASKRFKIGDVVRVTKKFVKDESREATLADDEMGFAPGPEGAVVVLDPRTRRLMAVVGGFSQEVGDFNRATKARRQAGSTFKAFVYAAAIQSREFSAATIVNDAPEVYELWKPENYSNKFAGPVSLRRALAKSINTVAIRVTHEMTSTRVMRMARSMGIESPLADDLSIALGSGAVTPMEMTNAFATFANGGKLAKVRSIKSVAGEELPPSEFKQALDPKVSYILVDMLRSVVQFGTGAKAGVLKMDLAGKTGTSNDERDAWFMGMTQDLVVGVWVGFDDFRKTLGSKEGGSYTALPIFVQVMKELGSKDSEFEKPDGLSTLSIDPKTGLLDPERVHEGTYTEVFLPGTAPTDIAPAPGDVVEDSAIMDQYGGMDAARPEGENSEIESAGQ